MEVKKPSWTFQPQHIFHISDWRQLWHQMIVILDLSSLHSWCYSYSYTYIYGYIYIHIYIFLFSSHILSVSGGWKLMMQRNIGAEVSETLAQLIFKASGKYSPEQVVSAPLCALCLALQNITCSHHIRMKSEWVEFTLQFTWFWCPNRSHLN